MADSQQGIKRRPPSDALDIRPTKKTTKEPQEPSSPLKAVPTSPTARTTSQQTLDFQPLQALYFSRTITPLPDTAFEIFQLFCPLDLVNQWVEYTNRRPFWLPKRRRSDVHHAEGPSSRRARQNAWIPVTSSEIYVFFGILIYMSVHQEPTIEDYWSTSPSNPTHIISRFMTRDRFQLLYRRFSIFDATAEESTFEKVDPWSRHIQRTAIQLWKPGSHITVDEAMVKFTGRSKEVVKMPSKPIPIGYKVWVMAESGYFLQWSFHAKGEGPVGLNIEEYPDLAPTQAIVAHLLSQLPPPPTPDHGYHCFMDNLFSTPELFSLLRTRNIAATGTTRPGRVTSKQLVAIKASESKKDSVPWGTVYVRKHTSAEVMQFGFKDNAFVLALSTAYTGLEAPIVKTRHQPSKTSTCAKTARVPFAGQAVKELEIPIFIDTYNNHMNGVDIGDQLRANSYNTGRRTRRGGWQALCHLFLLEVAIINSFLLDRYSSQRRREAHTFRRQLYEQIFIKFGQAKVAPQMPNTVTHTPVRRTKRGWCAYCSSTKRNTILGAERAGPDGRRKHLVFFGCNSCDVALCNENTGRDCWLRWHNK